MKQVESRQIDDRTYDLYQMDIKPALKVMTRLTKLIGEPLGALALELTGKGQGPEGESFLDANIQPEVFATAARAFVSRLDENEVIDTVELVMAPLHVQTEVDKGTRPLKFNLDMRGRPGHLFKVLVAALEVNYADFFGDDSVLGGIVRKLPAGLR